MINSPINHRLQLFLFAFVSLFTTSCDLFSKTDQLYVPLILIGLRCPTPFNNISVILWRSILLVEETGGPRENNRPVASHQQTLLHNVVSSTLHHEQGSNSQIAQVVVNPTTIRSHQNNYPVFQQNQQVFLLQAQLQSCNEGRDLLWLFSFLGNQLYHKLLSYTLHLHTGLQFSKE